ncbi:phosphoribosylformylglycinamidine synthase II [Candidatus Endolissoclinum faulkneri L5]|uniref:Phosphoribosylformylglycinamidine synthase subunit PurL n=1 Tax=Candidatus Endolissoclinum faulkneri L5 TaxID=1401328 RepID=V9TUN9_9PROT|nr:phosphoribosylformylglycinamidine synthase subunit PurL [Candidatus Endolissoclinum faulkneri]AHC73867.1 phosphoribosylformylglycinamidine synthase II [Candidatus Endolissoclinum faulkneri L5]
MIVDTVITEDVVSRHGLTQEEYKVIINILGRKPNLNELGIFSVMWSEHCSYKSSKRWLKTLETKASHVIQGPGENAGVIDIGGGIAVVFKIESHNHPSFIDPYQGAATGVGGILRDIFTMGARPIANLNALRFGDPQHSKTRHLLSGVVAGIGGYSNCVGVPTVAGEVNFHPSYNDNILVNTMTVGITTTDRIFYSAAAGPGNPVVYVGAKTGRDGIHGATMASKEFDKNSEDSRPTVQVGDPFTEKLLLEACLELMERECIIAIQDMGAAGLTSASLEMADKGSVGIELDLDRVPVRELRMSTYEIMLSESQERMLMIMRWESVDKAQEIFKKWELDFAIIGSVTETGRLVLKKDGTVQCDIPIRRLVGEAPEYNRPYLPILSPSVIAAADVPAPQFSLGEVLVKLISCPDTASRRWIWEQYDHLVMGCTMIKPGEADSGVIRINDTQRCLAVTVDSTPRYCLADPKIGSAQAVVETWRNIIAVGATPLGVTNNLNFGNPQNPTIMGQMVGCIKGMGEACKALDYPIVSGNVSLYNETNGNAILPTPVVGGVGVIDNCSKIVTSALRNVGDTLLALGQPANRKDGWLGSSLYLREIEGREEGAPPPIDFVAEKQAGNLVRNLIAENTISACHDVSDGGLLVSIAEMALVLKVFGVDIVTPEDILVHAWGFGEDQGRYIVATSSPMKVIEAALSASVPAAVVGVVNKSGMLTLNGEIIITVKELSYQYEKWLPGYMSYKN